MPPTERSLLSGVKASVRRTAGPRPDEMPRFRVPHRNGTGECAPHAAARQKFPIRGTGEGLHQPRMTGKGIAQQAGPPVPGTDRQNGGGQVQFAAGFDEGQIAAAPDRSAVRRDGNGPDRRTVIRFQRAASRPAAAVYDQAREVHTPGGGAPASPKERQGQQDGPQQASFAERLFQGARPRFHLARFFQRFNGPRPARHRRPGSSSAGLPGTESRHRRRGQRE